MKNQIRMWLLTAVVGLVLAVATAPAQAGVNLIANGGFETGSLSDWVTQISGTHRHPECKGEAPSVQARGSAPGEGLFRMIVDGSSGGSIDNLPNVSCVNISQQVEGIIDPRATYVLSFHGTVVEVDFGDLVTVVDKTFDEAFNGSLGYDFTAVLLPGWCPESTCFSLAFSFLVVGTGQDAGFLDAVSFVKVDATIAEPGTLAVLGFGLMAIARARRQRRLAAY